MPSNRWERLQRRLDGLMLNRSAGRYVFTGAPVEDFNQEEFRLNAIEGNYQPVIDMDFGGDVPDEDWRPSPKSLGDVGVESWTQEEYPVTGGLTDDLSTSVNFSGPGNDLGVVLVLNAEKIPDKVVSIDYQNREFWNAAPEVAAHVDTLAEGAGVVNGEFKAYMKRSHKSDDWYIDKWGDNVFRSLTEGTYPAENEAVALAPEINLDGSVEYVVGYYGQGVSPQTFGGVLTDFIDEIDEYRSPSRLSRAVEDDWALGARLAYELTKKKADYDRAPFWIVVVEDMNDWRNGGVTREQFVGAYSAQGVVEDYDKVPAGVLG